MSVGEVDQDFMQSFATTIHPSRASLPELTFVWMPRSELSVSANSLSSLRSKFHEPDGPTELEIQDYVPNGQSVFLTTLAWHLKAGRATPPEDATYDDYVIDYFGAAQNILLQAELPVRASPLQGVSLSTLLGSGGAIGVMKLFHRGVTPAEAAVSVLFVAGAMIVFGTANAVRRALEVGVEQKLLSVFGIDRDLLISEKREAVARQERTLTQTMEKARARSVTEEATITTGRGSRARTGRAIE